MVLFSHTHRSLTLRVAVFAAASFFGLGLVTSAHAATYYFTYDTTTVLRGNPITADAVLTTVKDGIFEDILSATGSVNGSAITGLDPDAVNVIQFSPQPIEDVGFTTESGIKYDFFGGSGGVGNGSTLTFGKYALAPNQLPTPLPASAPMFGAALLGLAAVGYVAKRKKAVVAA